MSKEATFREFAPEQRVFGRYTLKKILGRGGMGVVWLARDEELEREVALKFLPDLVVLDKALLLDLKRETRRSLELTHKNIVRIYDFVQSENSACISMEYIDGDTLSNLRAEKEQKVFQPAEIAAWTAQLCDALDYAHNHARIIHRDLKPANLMVNQKGDLKVSDFGIARSLGDSMSKLTLASAGTSGTLVYMSPQQLDGERGTHLDDIYSLGATLYDLLTGKPPFYSGNVDRQIHERSVPSLTERRREFNLEPAFVPPVWEAVVATCLAKDPAKRPQSAAQVAERLQLSAPRSGTVTVASKKQPKRQTLWIGLAALGLVALAGFYFVKSKSPIAPAPVPQAAPSAAPAIPEKSIAVLPFENLSDEKENAYFTDGVQDEILTDLAKIADLKVISRTSVMQYKTGVARNLREIAQQLGVAHVLEGSVQRAAGKVRVNARLIDIRTEKHLWAHTYDREVADVFAIETELAQSIANELQAKLSPNEKSLIEEQPTQDLVAYDLYVRATSLIEEQFNSPSDPKDLLQAEDLLQQAVARDPSFFLAYCWLSRAHDALYLEDIDHTPARLALAKSAIDSAFRLKPDSGETHLALAVHLYWGYFDFDHARAELEIARRTLPNNARIFQVTALIDRRQGRWSDAVRNMVHASELDPQNFTLAYTVAGFYFATHNYEQTRAALERVLALKPDLIAARLDLGGELEMHWRGQTQGWHAAIEKILAADPAAADDEEMKSARFTLALYERDFAAAERAAATLPEKNLEDGLGRGFLEGVVARAKGDAAAARDFFTRARAEEEEALRQRPDEPDLIVSLGVIDAGLGRKEEALREGRRAMDLMPIAKNPSDGLSVLHSFAWICAWTGERELAIEKLDILAKLPGGITYGQLRLNPAWDSLRGAPRFEKIVASLAPK